MRPTLSDSPRMSSGRIGALQQLRLSLFGAPRSIVSIPRRTVGYFFLYLGLCAVVLGLTAWMIGRSEGFVRGLLLTYLFPESWHDAMGLVVDKFLDRQIRAVLANATIGGSLLMVSLLLFPVKEMLSASFEREAQLIDDPIGEHPLWEQAWEEIKLFLAYIAIQGTVFWIGYSPVTWRQTLALVISYTFLFVSFSIDFIAPPLQRHKGHYSRILKTLATHPIATVVFGAVFAAPGIFVSTVVLADAELTAPRSMAILFGTNVVAIACAATAGTWLGAKLFSDFARTKRSGMPARVVTWTLFGGLLLANVYAFGAVGMAVHKKSQIFKCDYSVQWSSFDVDLPGVTSMLKGSVDVGIGFDVVIHNSTSVDVELEDNRIEIRHQGDLVGTTKINPIQVGAGQTSTQNIKLQLDVNATFVRRGRSLLSRDAWTITLYIAVAPGFDFPIYLLTDN